MAVFYVDSSALVKRYFPEIGSSWFISLFNGADNLFLTTKISVVEVVSAFNRKLREHIISENEYNELFNSFLVDCHNEYLFVDVNDNIIKNAIKLLQRNVLRAYDAIQLSSSIITNNFLLNQNLSPVTFISSDDRLITAAKNEGLLTDNPNLHSEK